MAWSTRRSSVFTVLKWVCSRRPKAHTKPKNAEDLQDVLEKEKQLTATKQEEAEKMRQNVQDLQQKLADLECLEDLVSDAQLRELKKKVSEETKQQHTAVKEKSRLETEASEIDETLSEMQPQVEENLALRKTITDTIKNLEDAHKKLLEETEEKKKVLEGKQSEHKQLNDQAEEMVKDGTESLLQKEQKRLNNQLTRHKKKAQSASR
eukprot:688362_1